MKNFDFGFTEELSSQLKERTENSKKKDEEAKLKEKDILKNWKELASLVNESGFVRNVDFYPNLTENVRCYLDVLKFSIKKRLEECGIVVHCNYDNLTVKDVYLTSQKIIVDKSDKTLQHFPLEIIVIKTIFNMLSLYNEEYFINKVGMTKNFSFKEFDINPETDELNFKFATW